MPHLRTEPPGTLATLGQLFAVADAMERMAEERYHTFAQAMRDQGRDDLADVFEAIAAEEGGHVDSVAAWSVATLGHAPDAGQLPWPALPTFEPDDEAAMTGSATLTPYRALSIAVRNEERAFALWSYLAAQTAQTAVRDAAERMAKEELNHVAIFRRARREAFRREREAGGEWLSAAQAEDGLEALLRGQAATAEAVGRLTSRGEEGEDAPRRTALATVKVWIPPSASALQLAERLADAYLEAAERCRDDALMPELQRLASDAVRRIASLRPRRVHPDRGRS